MTLSRLAEQLAISPATEHLGTSLASVAGMIRRMKRDRLVDILPNKEIVFTEAGRTQAQSMMRRHQLAECLLVNMLGMELHKVHAEAHRLEHAISPEVEAKMAERLGNPQRCPFGHPIPGTAYRPPPDTVGLNRVPPGTPMVVERIPEDDPRLVQYLVANGLLPGAEVEVVDVASYRGTLTIAVGGTEVVVGLQVAPRILVHSPAIRSGDTGTQALIRPPDPV
ncbi:MAG: metal-dependent transcriptional regulator [Dehalococcoidia bacterium]|nr:metal-dependent transcriptional regulator [Dehalococcoidia bacterium]